MRERLSYALGKTTNDLHALFVTEVDHEIVQAFVLTLGGFAGIQFAIEHDGGSFIIVIFTACVTATLFFFSIVGCIAFAGTLYDFTYNLTAGHKYSFELLGLSGWTRGWRVALSAAVSGIMTIAVIALFDKGVSEIPIVGGQYPTLL